MKKYIVQWLVRREEPGNRMKAELQSYLKGLSETKKPELYHPPKAMPFEGNFSANYQSVQT